MRFRGRYDYTIDDRGRVPLPPRYRHAFTEGAVLVEGAEGCVEVYTQDAFERLSELVEARPRTDVLGRRARRGVHGHAYDADLDGQGRVLIPPHARRHGDLEGQVIIIGSSECLEIWNASRWEAEDEAVVRDLPISLRPTDQRRMD